MGKKAKAAKAKRGKEKRGKERKIKVRVSKEKKAKEAKSKKGSKEKAKKARERRSKEKSVKNKMKEKVSKKEKGVKKKCDEWLARQKANKELARALRSQVRFNGGKTTLTNAGKSVLNKVAAVLRKYSFMKVTVEGRSPARGAWGKKLTTGRAATTAKYLKSRGCKNKMTEKGRYPIRMIGIVLFGTGTTPADPKPGGCNAKRPNSSLPCMKPSETKLNCTSPTGCEVLW